MQQRRWIHAPEFIWKPEESWPVKEALSSKSVLQDDPEVRKNTAVFITVVKNIEIPTDQLISFFSDWMRLLKAVAWYLKLKNALMLTKRRKELSLGHIDTRSCSQKVSTELDTFRTKLDGQLLNHSIKTIIPS